MKRVLVIDDCLPSRKAITRALTESGFAVIADDGNDKSAPACCHERGDVILMTLAWAENCTGFARLCWIINRFVRACETQWNLDCCRPVLASKGR